MKGLRSPHLLIIGNPHITINNLKGIISDNEIRKIQHACDKQVKLLWQLAESHGNFVKNISNLEWRQIISRLYYAAYNGRRAVILCASGSYSIDSSDHKMIGNLPDKLNNHQMHGEMLRQLREDRNLADYSHEAKVEDLFTSPEESRNKVSTFLLDCKNYLNEKGLGI